NNFFFSPPPSPPPSLCSGCLCQRFTKAPWTICQVVSSRGGDIPTPSGSNISQLPTPSPRGDADESRKSQSGASQPHMPRQVSPQTQAEPFDMGSMSSALPDPSYQGYGQPRPQRYPSSQQPPVLFQLQNVPQFVNQGSMNAGLMPYNIPYQPHYQGVYNPNHPVQHHISGVPVPSQFYQNPGFIQQSPQQPGSNFFIQTAPFNPQGQGYGGSQSPVQYAPRNSFAGEGRGSSQPRGSEYLGGATSTARSSGMASSPSPSSVVRGPPRKPRQNGHAIWIGNLPPQADLMSLVLHVCKETSGLESVFLISKSNCAFANYKDEEACAAAQLKIHDSRFQTVRLVSRLRRSSAGPASAIAAPTGPAALTPSPRVGRSQSPDAEAALPEVVGVADEPARVDGTSLPQDKFFIVKSLTVEDLELSVRNGIWATQSHNEDVLNKAYEAALNVYLIFSANKSGEYFGYARMISPIDDDPAAAIEFAPKAQAVEDPELPKAIPTPATEFAPRGRIIDDSARGTIFWEAERDEAEAAEEEDENQSEKKCWWGRRSSSSKGMGEAIQDRVGINHKASILPNQRITELMECQPRSENCSRWNGIRDSCWAATHRAIPSIAKPYRTASTNDRRLCPNASISLSQSWVL
ncbi:hypothetical protein B7494_g8153, partial [Chlorociboria aeruginascens]